MLLFNNSPIAWLNRPYFDLSPYIGGSPHLYAIELSYQNLINNPPAIYNLQVNYSSLFRKSLLEENRLLQYNVDNPLQLPNELRTERWNQLCDYLIHYQELKPVSKLLVMNLVRSLSLHQTVLEYVPQMSEAEIASDQNLAALALCRAVSSVVSNSDYGYLDDLKEIEIIATNAPSSSLIRAQASILLLVRYATTFRDLPSAEHWRAIATQEIQDIKPLLNDFQYNLLMSIYYRAVTFVPLLHRDKEKVIQEMELCEFYGKSLICENEIQQIVANENMNILTESRVKEALWLGDLDLAQERARRLIAMEPLDSRYRLELGELLIKVSKIEEAAKIYASATRLGPPGTAVAWFMKGQCYEALGEIEIASDSYLTALQIDSEAISAVERLAKLAPDLGNSALVNWSKLRLMELQKQKQMNPVNSQHLFISEVSSELKTAAQGIRQ
ncbi:MAG: tetratricopeptide repeat protein [Nostoc sp.]|uniref:tetratricopeptide repeat protein n=1 Tax=Nostoc sp. TaxID=1180 RepID=UPI002FF4834C